MRICRGALLTVLLILAALPGCSGSLGTLSGDVTYDGQPVGEGQIVFVPADGNGPEVADKITNGKYTVSRVPPGPKIVRIEAYRKVNFASSSEEMMKRAAEARKRGDDSGLVDPADVIPPNAEGNNAKVEVKAGSQTLDFHLKKPGPSKGR
jgi:hypothetical protein